MTDYIRFSYENNLDNTIHSNGKLAFVTDNSCDEKETFVKMVLYGGEEVARLYRTTTQGGYCLLLIIEDVDCYFKTHRITWVDSDSLEKKLKKLLNHLGNSVGRVVANIILEQRTWLYLE